MVNLGRVLSAIIKVQHLISMTTGRRYLVSGKVQGVGFRFFTEDTARREGLTGFVRNLDDGRVEAVVLGEKESIARFERSLGVGPPLSRVTDIAIEMEPPVTGLIGFHIRE